MIIRLSSDMIRIRLSQGEAGELADKGWISERLFLDAGISVELRVALHGGDLLEWSAHAASESHLAWRCDVPRTGFMDILTGTQNRDANIKAEKQLPSGESLTLVLEVDLWDEEKRSRLNRRRGAAPA